MYEVSYKCYKCNHQWKEENSCAHDSECPECNSSDNTPIDFVLNLTILKEEVSALFPVNKCSIVDNEVWLDGIHTKLDENRNIFNHKGELYQEVVELLNEFCSEYGLGFTICQNGHTVIIK